MMAMMMVFDNGCDDGYGDGYGDGWDDGSDDACDDGFHDACDVRGSTMRQKLDNHCSKFANYEMKPTKNIWRRKSMDDNHTRILMRKKRAYVIREDDDSDIV